MTTLLCRWNAEHGHFTPLRGNLSFEDRQTYSISVKESRSKRSHDHFFACVHDAWESRPEALEYEFPSPDHLRKYALVRAGYARQVKVVCESREAAMDFATQLTAQDLFSVVDIESNIVTMWTAHSQSLKAMGKKRFQQSKEDCAKVITQMIGADFFER